MDIYGYHAGKLGVRRFTSVNVETSPYQKIYLDCLKNMGLNWKECYDELFLVFVLLFYKLYIFINTMVEWKEQIVWLHATIYL